MDMVPVYIMILSMLAIAVAQIWLILIINRESSFAAILCLVVPFLPFFFIKDHWKEAKPAVITWIVGLLTFSATLILAATNFI